MKFRDYLNLPFVLVAEAVKPDGDGPWRCRAAYPDLPDCIADGYDATSTIAAVELARVRTILAMLRAGNPPAILGTPLGLSDPLVALSDADAAEFRPLLDADESELART